MCLDILDKCKNLDEAAVKYFNPALQLTLSITRMFRII